MNDDGDASPNVPMNPLNVKSYSNPSAYVRDLTLSSVMNGACSTTERRWEQADEGEEETRLSDDPVRGPLRPAGGARIPSFYLLVEKTCYATGDMLKKTFQFGDIAGAVDNRPKGEFEC
jgi:hypothetical protein